MLNISVIYATPEQQFEVALSVEANCTVALAIKRSGVLDQFAHLQLATMSVGIFSQAAKLDDGLHDGDRIEIYRPLEIDPKAARLLRAKRSASRR